MENETQEYEQSHERVIFATSVTGVLTGGLLLGDAFRHQQNALVLEESVIGVPVVDSAVQREKNIQHVEGLIGLGLCFASLITVAGILRKKFRTLPFDDENEDGR